mgnify:CR=1 FL=1
MPWELQSARCGACQLFLLIYRLSDAHYCTFLVVFGYVYFIIKTCSNVCLNQMVYVLFEFAHPNMSFVSHAIAEIVTNYAILGILNELGLSLFVKSVEDDHGERILIFFLN